MNADERSRYFQELTRNLQHEGLTVKPETEDGLLPVEMEGQRLCQATETGAVRYWKEDVSGGVRYEALNRVTDIARTSRTRPLRLARIRRDRLLLRAQSQYKYQQGY